MSLNMSIKCYNCQTPLDLPRGSSLGRTEECPSCGVDLRCCKMCFFYDTSAYNECREPTAERILEKEKANFCDFFKVGHEGSGGSQKEDLIAQANALFKN